MTCLLLGFYLLGVAVLVPILMSDYVWRDFKKVVGVAMLWPCYAILSLVAFIMSLVGHGIVLGAWIVRIITNRC